MFRDMDDRGITFPIPERLERPEGLSDQLDAIRGYDTTDAARGIKVPTLVVHGGEDLMVAPEEGRKVADAVEGSRFLLLGSAGHSIPFGECWTQLRAFIGSNA